MGTSIYDIRVKDIVTRDAVTLNADDTIEKALMLMDENRVSALPVIDKRQRCVGILSATDLVELTRDADQELRQVEIDPIYHTFLVDKLTHSLGGEKVQSYMSETVTTVSLETPIGRAAQKMLRNHVHHLPVVDHDDHLIGIVSTIDILGEFADAAPE